MAAASAPDNDEVLTGNQSSPSVQRFVIAAGTIAAFFTVLGSAFFIFWMAILAKTYVDEVGGWCGTVIAAIHAQLVMLAPWCLLVIYVTSNASIRLGIAPALACRSFQAAVTSWISLFIGMLIGGF